MEILSLQISHLNPRQFAVIRDTGETATRAFGTSSQVPPNRRSTDLVTADDPATHPTYEYAPRQIVERRDLFFRQQWGASQSR